MPSFPRRPHALVALIATVVGCSPVYDTSKKGPAPPHGGSLLSFGDDTGLVEVVHTPVQPNVKEVRSEVAFYVLNTDATPFTPAPTNGVFLAGKKSVNLVSEGGGLVTPGGPPLFPDNAIEGSLTFELDGKKIAIPLGVR